MMDVVARNLTDANLFREIEKFYRVLTLAGRSVTEVRRC